MKYYKREMHGSFVRYRLVKLPDDIVELPEDDKEDTVLAHKWHMPDTDETHAHYFVGPEKTSDDHMMGGHHVGDLTEITEEQANSILAKCKKVTI